MNFIKIFIIQLNLKTACRERFSKKARRLSSQKEQADAIEELKQKYDLSVLLDCTGMARSKYAEIKTLIRQIYHKHNGSDTVASLW